MDCFAEKPVVEMNLNYESYPEFVDFEQEMVYDPEETRFSLWAPTAEEVKLMIYEMGEGDLPLHEIALQPGVNGSWQTSVKEDLLGKFYTFRIKTGGEWLDETTGLWAKAVGINGERAAVIRLEDTEPTDWKSDKAPVLNSFSDIIIYETHIRDFTASPSSGLKNRGKYLAFTEQPAFSPEGKSTGVDHLKELGITHIHLLPCFDFATVDEKKSDSGSYNWGYDPVNFQVPDGSYATDPYNPVVRIREFKEMVMTLHRAGIRVILDVVYSHTYYNDKSCFSLTVPGYFYRHRPDGSYSNASGCGNEVATERKMVRRFILDSLLYWVKEYHIDGFRFDLMGIHDIESMQQIRAELSRIDPSIFLYGEGWTAAGSPYPEWERAIKKNTPQLNGIATYSDDFRDALKGMLFDDKEGGFVSGFTDGNQETIRFGLVGAVNHPQIRYEHLLYARAPFANDPVQVINYVSCHDNLCLIDKLKLSAPEGTTPEELIRFNKLAQTIIFTAQGIPFIRGGEEIGQDKKGVHNSYKSPDDINAIDWSKKAENEDLYSYYRGLILLRKKYGLLRLATGDEVRNSLQFIDTHQSGLIALQLRKEGEKDMWLIYNGNRYACELEIPVKHWKIVCRNGMINPEGIEETDGGKIQIAPSSAFIVVAVI